MDSFEDAEHDFEKLTTHSDLAKEWHLTKNKDLTPQDVSTFSNKKVWWYCFSGHEWDALVNCRVKGVDCPYCSRRKS